MGIQYKWYIDGKYIETTSKPDTYLHCHVAGGGPFIIKCETIKDGVCVDTRYILYSQPGTVSPVQVVVFGAAALFLLAGILGFITEVLL